MLWLIPADTREQRIGTMGTPSSLRCTPPAGDQRFRPPGFRVGPRKPRKPPNPRRKRVAEIAGNAEIKEALTAPSQCLHGLQHLVDMAGHLHLVPDLGHGAGLVDQEGGALDAHVLAAVEALLDPGAVLRADLAVLVRHQREGEPVLLLELVVLLHAVLGDADHRSLDLGEVGQGIAKAAGLGGAARRVVLGIEVEHHRLAAQVRQFQLLAAVGGGGEIRCFLAFFDTHKSLPLPTLRGFQPAARAGSSTMRRYIARAACVSAERRARNSPRSRAPSVSAIRRRWPSGAFVSSNAASSPFRVSRSRLCTSEKSVRAVRSRSASFCASRPAAAVRRSISAGWGSSRSGRSTAWRSARYWATKSMSNRPPGRCLKSHGLFAGMWRAMRSRMSATSRTSAAGSRARQSVILTMSESRSASAGGPWITRARVSAICSHVQADCAW